jgi:hypothetical protein
VLYRYSDSRASNSSHHLVKFSQSSQVKPVKEIPQNKSREVKKKRENEKTVAVLSSSAYRLQPHWWYPF